MQIVEKHTNARRCRMADEPEDFQRLGLDPESVGAWEDGLRTDTGPGSYEWWYFDAHLDDGSSLVIMFNTKNPMTPHRPLEPTVSVQLNRPGAEALTFERHASAEEFNASKDSCDVCIADNRFRGDLHHYEIHVAHEDTTIDVELTAQVRPWRKGAGRVYFGENDEHFFAVVGVGATGERVRAAERRWSHRTAHGHRVPRPQLGRRSDAQAHEPLVLG